MGKRGAKPKFTDVYYPNQDCKFSSISGKGNIVGNGTYKIKNKRVRKYICHECGRVFNDTTDTIFNNLRKDESVIQLALKMVIKGMSIEAITDVFEVGPATVSISKVEMDELWVIVKKKLRQERKLKMTEHGCG